MEAAEEEAQPTLRMHLETLDIRTVTQAVDLTTLSKTNNPLNLSTKAMDSLKVLDTVKANKQLTQTLVTAKTLVMARAPASTKAAVTDKPHPVDTKLEVTDSSRLSTAITKGSNPPVTAKANTESSNMVEAKL